MCNQTFIYPRNASYFNWTLQKSETVKHFSVANLIKIQSTFQRKTNLAAKTFSLSPKVKEIIDRSRGDSLPFGEKCHTDDYIIYYFPKT